MVEDNNKKFGKCTVGVHGKELPKFAEHNTEYWKDGTGYNPDPKFQSQTLMRMTLRESTEKDPLTLNAIVNEEPPADPFKTSYKRLQRKSEVATKVNHVVHNDWKPRDPNQPTPTPGKTNYRWTAVMQKFSDGSMDRSIIAARPATVATS